MISPLITYKENLVIAGIRKQMTDRFNDLYVYNRRPKTDFLETDEETAVLKLGKFIPGKIYTYQYDPLYKDKLDYYDVRPIILCTGSYIAKGTKNSILTGINLNFLPEKIIVLLLESFYNLFPMEINKSYDLAGSNKINFDISKILQFFKDAENLITYFGNKNGIGYQFAYRQYITDRIKKLRYVEYQHWEMLPLLIKTEIIGAPLEKIYLNYWGYVKSDKFLK